MTQYLDWKVGDRVVCVDDAPTPGWSPILGGLKAGSTYTIRRVGILDIGHPHDGMLMIWLNEIERIKYTRGELGFYPHRFRKVQPRKTSIAVFERLLNTQNNEVETA